MGSTDYSLAPSIDIFSSAVIFKAGYPDWDYSVRLNKTYIKNGRSVNSPSTVIPNIDISRKEPSAGSGNSAPYLEAYTTLGVFSLFDTVNSFIATDTVCKTTGNCLTGDEVSIKTLGMAQFPNAETFTQGFWSAVGYVFGLLIIISLLLPLSNIIKALVQEKETKLREGMMMMSLRTDALWTSWIFQFMLLFLPLSAILTAAGQRLFEFSSPSYIFLYFLVR
jgi:hypothetical protein